MRIAIMQPYFFPYLGYFELIKTVDIFIFLTDVQYIRKGWVNRNRIRSNNNWQYLTVPVHKASRYSLIYEMKMISGWGQKHCSIIENTYGKMVIENQLYKFFILLDRQENLCKMLCDSLIFTANYLGIGTKFMDSRDFGINKRKQWKLIDICKVVGAKTYVNASGGRDLYQKEDFNKEGIELEFMIKKEYKNNFSILDLIFGKS